MPNIISDNGYFSDSLREAVMDGELELILHEVVQQRSIDDRRLDSEFDISISTISSIGLDLFKLWPRKFWNSEILADYMAEVSIQVGNWLNSVKNIVKLLNSRTVSEVKYLRYLGALIGVEFPPEDTTSIGEMRKNILQAVDWYKVKGTYKSIKIISLIQSFVVNVYDMYTNDYVNFYPVEWFVGRENENPSGFDSSYYKSPHFGVEILLNRVYQSESGDVSGGFDHLWEVDKLDNLYSKVEETRPVHTVPHYMLLLNPKTDESGNVVEVEGEIKSKVLGDWELSTKYFDEENSGVIWNFDSGINFDESTTDFINSITKWVIGIGNPDIESPSFNIEHPVLQGSINPDSIIITDNKISFSFIIPKLVVMNEMSELGLYIPGSPDRLVVGCVFPRIDKDSRVEIKVLVEVYKKYLN